MSKLVVRFSKKGWDVKHLDFIGYLAMLDTVTIKGKEFPVVPATKGMNKGQVADKRVVFWKLYEKLYRLQIQNDGIRRQAYQNGYKYVPVTVTKKQLAMYVAGYATEKPIDRMISQMIEMGLISREIKGQKGKGGSMYIIHEPLENLLSQLPDEALKQMGFKAGELHTVEDRLHTITDSCLHTISEKDDKPLNDKEKESENIENSPLEEVKPQSDQEVSSSLDDQKVENETEPSVEVNNEAEQPHTRAVNAPTASQVMPDWGNNWTPDDDDFLFKSETVAAASSGLEADTPTIRWGNIPNQEKAKADETDWDALLIELGLDEPEPPEPAKVTPEKITTEWDDNVPF
ncbi:hypothetical protein EY268_14740 [Shigella sonnei]|nr:hypothetical protein [Shigella sonnei]